MASSLVKQDLPPKGGYPPIEYARNLPKRGPSGLMMFIGGAAVMAFGFYHVIMGNRRRWYVGSSDKAVGICIHKNLYKYWFCVLALSKKTLSFMIRSILLN